MKNKLPAKKIIHKLNRAKDIKIDSIIMEKNQNLKGKKK
jgi:hypothetical protein